MEERWLPVVGWEGFYEVSDHGRVRSLDRIVTLPNGSYPRRGRMMKLCNHNKGYVVVGFRREGRLVTRLVHTVVLEAFVGPAPEGMEGCHGDNNKKNNRLDNLRWDTHRANCLERAQHGVQVMGKTSGHAVLTEAKVLYIREAAAAGVFNTTLAEKFGVTPSNIGYIVKRKSWKHI